MNKTITLLAKTITTVILLSAILISQSKAMVYDLPVDYRTTKEGKELYLYYIDRIVHGRGYDFYPDVDLLIQAIVQVESNFDPNCISSAGCIGLTQISPYWQAPRAKKLGIVDLWNPYNNILVGTDFLRDLYFNYANQDMVLAIMMYNMDFSSARAIRRNGGMSDYAREVLRLFNELKE